MHCIDFAQVLVVLNLLRFIGGETVLRFTLRIPIMNCRLPGGNSDCLAPESAKGYGKPQAYVKSALVLDCGDEAAVRWSGTGLSRLAVEFLET